MRAAPASCRKQPEISSLQTKEDDATRPEGSQISRAGTGTAGVGPFRDCQLFGDHLLAYCDGVEWKTPAPET
jgi:hypothetical protein